ncbi:tRNA uridine-5-carboxymethylaminomethyl(34) synthesis GTPase MnmE [Helicobacter labacensis]|uniref:tRNA uridine-5-carboxymethylaminomethyl(34) synthesis GTPase MnmE n=1 Tax=Helicobacter labacensis TaxID=2316079 RepID=UPI000EAECE6F|nr:tRNA uridine-5-carboxymethylaminomethyl(34) synthesis GTPase MnmE [Helicobacter labacensis]
MTSTNPNSSTIVAIATPPGLGAIAIIKLSGPKSLEILQALCQQTHFTPRHASLVSVYDTQSTLLDLCLALYFKGPHSYTGEDVAEIQCHGGMVVARLILQACLDYGAILAQNGEFTRRALLGGKMDLCQVDALAKLLEAKSANYAKAMAKQLKGALKDFVKRIRGALLELLASAEALIDYAEEDLPLDLNTRMQTTLQETLSALQNTLSVSQSKGAHLEGYRLSIVGKPNVGKSSFLNALLLEERALVSEIAGTTRDTIEEVISLYGSSLRIIDTAGIRPTEDAIERLGIAKSLKSMQESDVILALFDLSAPLDDQDQHLLELLQAQNSKTLCVIFNKNDCPPQLDTQAILNALPFLSLPPLYINTKEPCLTLLKDALQPLLLEDNPNDDLILTSLSQQQALEHTIAHLKEASRTLDTLELELFSYHLKDALESIATLSKPYQTEEVLDALFAQFCLGK